MPDNANKPDPAPAPVPAAKPAEPYVTHLGASCGGHFAGVASARSPRKFHAYVYEHGPSRRGAVGPDTHKECDTLVEGLRWISTRLLAKGYALDSGRHYR
jgi:hypothetical protein